MEHKALNTYEVMMLSGASEEVMASGHFIEEGRLYFFVDVDDDDLDVVAVFNSWYGFKKVEK